MAGTGLKSAEVKAFCENTASMLFVGMQIDEAVSAIAENSENKPLKDLCQKVYSELSKGSELSSAMSKVGGFPTYAVERIAAGEKANSLQSTLETLAVYYDMEARSVSKIRQLVTYPAILLCVMGVVLAFIVGSILPVFVNVYESMTDSITAFSSDVINVGIVIGWIALILTLVCAVIAVVAFVLSCSASGMKRLVCIIGRMPRMKKVIYAMALSRFTAAVSVYISSGVNSDDAVEQAISTVELPALCDKVSQAYKAMTEPVDMGESADTVKPAHAAKPVDMVEPVAAVESTHVAESVESDKKHNLAQVFADYQIYNSLHIRMLTADMQSDRPGEALRSLSEDIFTESIDGFDALIDRVEPVIVGFVVLAIGLTLVSVMFPLAGMMISLG